MHSIVHAWETVTASLLGRAANRKSCVEKMKFLGTTAVALASLSGQAFGRAVTHRSSPLKVTEHPDLEQRALLQNIVSINKLFDDFNPTSERIALQLLTH